MNKRGIGLVVSLILGVIILVVAAPVIVPLLQILVDTFASIAERSNFSIFLFRIQKACGSEQAATLQGIELGNNWHIMQFRDYDTATKEFIAKKDGKKIGNIEIMEDECNDQTCLCLVYVNICGTKSCTDIGGSCVSNCPSFANKRGATCTSGDIACDGNKKADYAQTITTAGTCDKGVCCVPSGANLYYTLYEKSGLYDEDLSAYISGGYIGGASGAKTDMWETDAMLYTLAQNIRGKNDEERKGLFLSRVSDFTEKLLSSYDCNSHYDIKECKSLNGAGACTEDTLITDRNGKPFLAYPYIPLRYKRIDRISFVREGVDIKYTGQEAYLGT